MGAYGVILIRMRESRKLLWISISIRSINFLFLSVSISCFFWKKLSQYFPIRKNIISPVISPIQPRAATAYILNTQTDARNAAAIVTSGPSKSMRINSIKYPLPWSLSISSGLRIEFISILFEGLLLDFLEIFLHEFPN